MSFGEHLDELRRRIVVGLIAFVVAFVAAFVFQDRLLGFFTQPYVDASASVDAEIRARWAAIEHEPTELARLFLLLIGKLEAAGTLPAEDIAELKAAAAEALKPPPPTLPPLQAIGPLETFGAYMLVCLLAALLVSAPVLLHELWKFVAAGLYAHERRIVTSVLPWSIALFFAGLAFGYYVLAELSVRFLVSYGDLEHVRPQVAIGSYLGLLFLLLLAMGLVFQVPLVMTVLSRVGLASPAFFRRQRKICILAIFIVAAIITPPDYVSQILVAVPMLILFELGILLSAVAARRRERSEKDAARA